MHTSKISSTLGCVGVLLFCAQFSSHKSIGTHADRPAVNVYGTVVDGDQRHYDVEYITIAGKFSDIAVYKEPEQTERNPDENKAFLDLRDIYQIRTVSPEKLKFNNRDYIKIEVVSHDANRTKREYIIEYFKRVFCNERNEAGPLQREFSFAALGTITIAGYKVRTEDCKKEEHFQAAVALEIPPAPSASPAPSAPELSHNQELLMKHLEYTAQQLPEDDERQETLKDTLLKLLDDLKKNIKIGLSTIFGYATT